MLVRPRYKSSSPHPCSTHLGLAALPPEKALGRPPALSPSSKEVRATGERGGTLPILLFGAEATSCLQRELDCSTAGCLLSPTGPSQLFSWADIAKSILGASQRCHRTMESAARGWFAPAEGERQNIAVHCPHGEGFCPPSQLSTWEDCECRVRGHSCGSRRALKPTQRLQRKEISSRKKCEAPGETSADRLGKAQPQLAGALPPPEQSSVPSHHAWHSQTRHGDGAVAISNLYKAWLWLYSSQKTSRTCFLIFFFCSSAAC